MNLCAHNETRTSLVKILMDMLLFDRRKLGNQTSFIELSYRLYACQRNVIYSRPQFSDGEDFIFCCCCFLFDSLLFSLAINIYDFFYGGYAICCVVKHLLLGINLSKPVYVSKYYDSIHSVT